MGDSMSKIEVDEIYNSTGDSDSGLDMSTNDTVKINIAGAKKVEVDSSGKVIMGTATTSHAHANADDLIIGNAPASGENRGITIVTGTDANGSIHFSDGTSSGNANIKGQIVYDHTNNRLRFYTNVTEHLYITDDGVIYYPEHSTDGGTSANAIIQSSNGKIERSTASSQKLKENIKDITMDCTKIQNLKVREFDYKSNYVTSTERADIGLIAEEVDAVEPMWTTQGYIDETDCKFKTDEYIKENSKTKHAIDIHWRRLQVGMLKEIQRLHTEIETLKTKVAALEDK